MTDDTNEHLSPFPVQYTLNPKQLVELTHELIAARTMDISSEHRFVAVEVGGDETYANLGRHIERVVFEAVFGNDAQQMEEEYGPYEAASRFFISIDRVTGQITGVLRVIQNSAQGLKTLNDVQGDPFNVATEDVIEQHAIDDPNKVWDVGTVAVLPEHRKGSKAVSVQLYRAMYLAAREQGIDHLVSIIDDKPFKDMTTFLGIPFVPLAGAVPGPYLGSEKSHPVYGYVPEFYEKMSRHRKTMAGYLARHALDRLVEGSEDGSITLK